LAGLGTLLLGFGGLRMARSRKGDAVDSEEMVAPSINPGGSLIDRYAQTELSATDAGDDDETQMPSTSSPDAETEIGDDHDKTQLAPEVSAEPGIGTGTGTGDEDPLAEVNVYLAYERFDKAEQLVRDGIDAHPQRPEYQLKLLEVFYAAKNTASFESSAEQLKTTVGAESELMSQAHAWWDELGTGRALFSDSDGPSTTEHSEAPSDDADGDDLFDFTAAQTGEQTSVDFELGFDDPSAEGTGASGDLNFDLGAVGDDSSANGDGSLDFDLGGFESTDNGPATQAMAAGAVGAVAAGLATGVDFDLGDGTSSDEFQSADSGLDFDLDTGDANEVPTAAGIAGDDGSLDIDLGGFDDAEQPAGQSAEGGGGLDFDLDDGTDSWLDLASLDDSTDVGALDFDLGDTSTLPKFEASATSVDELPAVEDDGLDLQLDTGSDGDDVSLALDMDTVIDGAASELDFDLGDIGAGDAGAGTMHGGVDPFADTGTADDSLALDIDLGSTDVISRVMDDESIANEISDFSENGLDFDLGDTGGDAAAAVEVPLDFGLALDLQTDANSSDDEPLALDMGLDAIGDGSVATVFQDARTEISDGSELDLDLGFDSGDDAEDFGLPILEADDDGDLAIDTVQLAPAAAQALRRSAEAFGTSTSESLGFDLGTGLDDAENSVGFGALDADLEQTQFSLRDVQSLPNDDEEDHTLVLGRSDASGEVDEMQTKLDLAQAYMDMGDTEGARNLLGEVMADGGDEQQRNASEMLSKLS
jgi:pilus assembly protein FimV